MRISVLTTGNRGASCGADKFILIGKGRDEPRPSNTRNPLKSDL